MFKLQIRATLLALFVPLLLNASQHVLTDEILKPEASILIDKMGKELSEKTGIHGYVLPTNEHFPIGFNLVEYSKKYEQNMTKPYVLFIFAPHAKITAKTETTGRIGIIPSSNELKKLYDYDAIRDAGLDVITVKDKNLVEDKHNIGVVQAFSELCDNVAESKNIKLTTTIPNDTRYIILVLKVILFAGLLLLLWIYFLRPLLMKDKNV